MRRGRIVVSKCGRFKILKMNISWSYANLTLTLLLISLNKEFLQLIVMLLLLIILCTSYVSIKKYHFLLPYVKGVQVSIDWLTLLPPWMTILPFSSLVRPFSKYNNTMRVIIKSGYKLSPAIFVILLNLL